MTYDWNEEFQRGLKEGAGMAIPALTACPIIYIDGQPWMADGNKNARMPLARLLGMWEGRTPPTRKDTEPMEGSQ